MQNIPALLLSPPVAFIIVLAAVLIFAFLLSFLAFKGPRATEDICKAYACGEDVKDHSVQPDYSRFFPFAFFFTVLHVAALVITTVPKISADSLIITLLYLGGAVIGLLVFFRKA